MDPNVEFHPPVTSTKSSRRSDRASAGQVPGTASASRSRSIAESTEDEDGGKAAVTTIQMNHTFNSGSLKTRRSFLVEDDSISSLFTRSDWYHQNSYR
jgi:hypothetical protein